MLHFVRKPALLFALLYFVCLSVPFAAAQTGSEWRAISPAELEMKTPQVEPDADAEAIFWEISLDDKKSNRLSYNHYVRVKIFTERGREKFSKFDIPFAKGKKVEEVAARVIRPDGTTVDVKPADIFEREIIRAGKIKVKAKSFAVAGIEPGVIVEYRYKETFKGDNAGGERLVFQRDIPIQRITYSVRPYEGLNLKFDFRNMEETRFVKGADGFYSGTITNVPALKEEPQMPPDEETRRWVRLSYNNFNSLTWALIYYQLGPAFNRIIKPSKEITQKAAELTAGAQTDEEKLRRIYEFTQKRIKNVNFDSSYTEEQLEAVKIKDIDDVLKRGVANSAYIDFLFASLAKAAGFEVSIVFAGDRSESFFNPFTAVNFSYVHPACVAVKNGGALNYYNPGTPYLPFGRLIWYEEDVYAMAMGENGYSWKKTPLSGVAQSPVRRSGKFKLAGDGTLEGLVRIEYEGHQAITRRRAEFKDSPAKREENLKEEIKSRMSAAEISDITIENFDDAAKPLTYIFKIRVPGYAQKTGKRLFFQPGFFEYGTNPLFASANRTHSIYFQYPWSEQDDLEFEVPKDFSLDNADAPGDVADSAKIGNLKINISIDKVNNKVFYKRNFYFGNGGTLLFPVATYQPLKGLFDAFHKADTHTITLKQIN